MGFRDVLFFLLRASCCTVSKVLLVTVLVCYLHSAGICLKDMSTKLPTVLDLIYWRDVKKSGIVFGSTLVLLLSLALFSFISVFAYSGLALLAVTLNFRLYKYILHKTVQKTEQDEHPFKHVELINVCRIRPVLLAVM
jgi:apolipoprotein N-acyltransferase